VNGQHHDLADLPPGKNFSTHSGRSWAPESVYMFGEEKNLLPLPGFEPHIINPIAQSL